jgi:hypothetical protein
MVNLTGDVEGPTGARLTEEVELWIRNPVECVQELLGNPAFRDNISYIPERVYNDKAGSTRVYDEMWTADWWWDTQVCLRGCL